MTVTSEDRSGFRGRRGYLSNFYESNFMYRGLVWLTAEHAFQAGKCRLPREFTWVRAAPNAAEAKRRGGVVSLRPDWEEVKVQVMRDVLAAKFAAGMPLAERLRREEGELVEWNTWGDLFWGRDARTGIGENVLGQLLEERRRVLREEASGD